MKKFKVLMCICLATYVLAHFLYYFGNDRTVDGTNGLWIFANPFTIFGLFLTAYWLIKKSASPLFVISGSLLLIGVETFYFLTWPVPTIKEHISPAYSFEIAHIGLYLSFITALGMLLFATSVRKTNRCNCKT